MKICRAGLIIILLLNCINTFAQSKTGSITGKIIASEDNKGLPYANLLIEGTTIGVSTDENGEFILRNIDQGTHTFIASYIGYEKTSKKVQIAAGKTINVDFVLTRTDVRTEDIIITAQRKGQLDAINQQINSNTLKNVVASDRLQINPDANAAEAISRLPGISLNRTGGEGSGIVIRGLDPKYNKILIDGVSLPSTDANNRSTSISGVSQYVLEGVEVFKSITADMEADATAGAINLRLGDAPEKLKFNIMAQSGYNNLNEYWKNYKFQADVSNRFFDNKLGALLNLSSENVNRSAQTLSANYTILTASTQANQLQKMYLNNINLNDRYRINLRNSGTLVLDYRLSPGSKLLLSNFFSNFVSDNKTVTKNFEIGNAGIGNNFNTNLGQQSNLFISTLKSENKFELFELTSGVSYSQTHNFVPDNKSWNFTFPNSIPVSLRDTASRRMPLETYVQSVTGSLQGDALHKVVMTGLSSETEDNIERKIDTYFDIKLPFVFTDDLSGYIKVGAKYKNQYKLRNYSTSYPNHFPTTLGDFAESKLPWIESINGYVTASSFSDHNIDDFLDGRFDFGWYPNFDNLNDFFNFYANESNYYRAHPELASPFPEIATFFIEDYIAIQRNNYRYNSDYIGTYIMSEINISKLITVLPGIRYEKISSKQWGWYTEQLLFNYLRTGHAMEDTHNDEYILPNFHVKLKPLSWMNVFINYTNTLSRPDYYSLVPIVYVNLSNSPQQLVTGNPKLKPEYWTNLDAQFNIFNNEIGLFAASGFYKKVKDMIWTPLTIRTPEDPPIEGFENTFGEKERVNIRKPVNHNHDVFIKGLEFEWQTNLWYLPSPFKYLTLNLNYTLMNSVTKYQRAETVNTQVGTDSRGRPIFKLITNYYIDEGQMINQPDNIANCSVGFNYKDLNLWCSYSFTGKKLLSFHEQRERNVYGLSYSRFDLQVTQKLPIAKIELLFNLANFNNPTESSEQLGDIRPTYLENYGWTVDLGARYRL